MEYTAKVQVVNEHRTPGDTRYDAALEVIGRESAYDDRGRVIITIPGHAPFPTLVPGKNYRITFEELVDE